ncbi:MAG: hypothetical protein ACK5QS_09300 [Pseudanabaenaceae cyanobacterium]|jgi:hypothetical protein
MIFTYSAPEHFQHMQSDAYPTPTIAVWHLKKQLLQQSQNSRNLQAQSDAPSVAAPNLHSDDESGVQPIPQEAINHLIATAEILAADLNPAQVNYVWRSCESIYLQNAAFVK